MSEARDRLRAVGTLRTMLDALTSGYSRIDIRNARRGLPLETNIGRLFATLAYGLDIAQEQSDKIQEWDDLDIAEGAVLDRHAANYGVRRDGVSDEYLRLLIKVKMISQISGGDIDTVLNAAAALFGVPVDSVDLREDFPAKIAVHVSDYLLSEEIRDYAAVIAQLMKRIVAGGIGIEVSFNTYREFITPVYFGSAAFDYTEIIAPLAN